jgi:uncharacterized protein YraI
MSGVRRMRQVMVGVAVAALLAGCSETSGSRLHVRAGPSTATRVITTLGPVGTHVDIACSTTGESIYGNSVWYRITEPAAGYVTSYYVRTDERSDQAITAC